MGRKICISFLDMKNMSVRIIFFLYLIFIVRGFVKRSRVVWVIVESEKSMFIFE